VRGFSAGQSELANRQRPNGLTKISNFFLHGVGNWLYFFIVFVRFSIIQNINIETVKGATK